jgi:hypothetical protein
MRLDRRLMLVGVLLVTLSTTMATQYATTRATYSFSIVHPSEADIRYIGSDNSSHDSKRVLRVANNASGTQFVTLEFGHWMPDSQKNYTAAFGIVNEESVSVNITHINVSDESASSYFDIWLHGNRGADVSADGSAVKVVEAGAALYGPSDAVWTLAAGDGDPSTMNASAADILTPWDEISHVRYSIDDTPAVNETSDFVWVQVSIDIDKFAEAQAATGTIYIYFRASAAP